MAPGDKHDNSFSRHSAEFKAWLEMMEAMDAVEIKEYVRQNKDVLTSEMKAAIEKVLQQKKPKKRKKRPAVHPILGAVLNFHKDDDDDTPPPSPEGAGAN